LNLNFNFKKRETQIDRHSHASITEIDDKRQERDIFWDLCQSTAWFIIPVPQTPAFSAVTEEFSHNGPKGNINNIPGHKDSVSTYK